ncbi:adenosylmethionine decarboxylase [Roseateles sp.]|jgi:S-adenosylmethionine decarboxylase|uniref:adenosylmethionine decarboxylase n=1 Tax=Roseateles sp. TaxID=1971397 RepID=UPI00391D7E38
MQGLHLVADLRGCRADLPLMSDVEALRRHCLAAVSDVGLEAVGELFHRFTPAPGESQSGVTGVVLLAESHLALHTWPELQAVTVDVYVCNLGQDNGAKARALMDGLLPAFEPQTVQAQELARG